MNSYASSTGLREDIKRLERLFLKKASSPVFATCASSSSSNSLASTHYRDDQSSSSSSSCSFPATSNSLLNMPFRLISASVDELVCELVDAERKKYRVNANICENYPQAPPVWFSESEDSVLTDIIEKLSSTADEDNKVISHYSNHHRFINSQV
jgi:hypothetical protein